VVDAHHVPNSGGAILASNHQSFFDPPLIGSMIPWRQFAFMAQEYLFKVPLLATLIRALNSVPVSGSGSDGATIKRLIKTLQEGRPVVVFPEGSRTADGAMHTFKRGVVLLMRRAKCPVVPAAVEGVFDAWPRHRKLPRFVRQRMVVVYGEPIAPEALRDEQALELLAQRIDELRLRARAILREQTSGRLPANTIGDGPTERLVEEPVRPERPSHENTPN
ncbi:MAG: 1-acyl-sn-glycerol-3-phosphate acyltransferase, partial [Salinibacterium sp.]|nr:1-acyl-sn-glycerol-3-phosphate acyltransferase [Salinibacterium sp.]